MGRGGASRWHRSFALGRPAGRLAACRSSRILRRLSIRGSTLYLLERQHVLAADARGAAGGPRSTSASARLIAPTRSGLDPHASRDCALSASIEVGRPVDSHVARHRIRQEAARPSIGMLRRGPSRSRGRRGRTAALRAAPGPSSRRQLCPSVVGSLGMRPRPCRLPSGSPESASGASSNGASYRADYPCGRLHKSELLARRGRSEFALEPHQVAAWD